MRCYFEVMVGSCKKIEGGKPKSKNLYLEEIPASIECWTVLVSGNDMLKTQVIVEAICIFMFSNVKVCAVLVNGYGKTVFSDRYF